MGPSPNKISTHYDACFSEASATAVAAPTSSATTETKGGDGVGEKEMVLPTER